jgi:nucleoside-diphosphate-sugar epimerase
MGNARGRGDMRVLVTGGAGYLGSVLTPLLLRLGHRVRIVDSLMYGGEAILAFFHSEGFEFLHGDLRDQHVREKACQDIDAIVHLAAIVGDPACARQPELAKAINRDATLALFGEAAREGVKRFIFASTCSNYGRMTDPASFVDELSELRPVSLYAETKVDVERTLLARSNGLPSPTILRFATIYGLSPRMRFDLTINEFAMELHTKRRLVVFGEQFWRPYAHVADVANAVSLVLEAQQENVGGQVFNVGNSDENYTKSQIVDIIRSLLDFPVEIEKVQKKEDPRDYRVSFSKIKSVLNYETKYTVRDGASEILTSLSQGIIKNARDARYTN